MSVSVGGVMVEFDGDASGAAAAMKAVSEKLDDLTRKERELKDALDAATKAGLSAEGGLNALRRAHADAATAVEKMRGSAAGVEAALPRVSTHASSASASMSSLRNAGQAVDNVMGPLQTTLGGVGQALGASTGMVQNLVGVMADLGMIVEKMGFWGAALTAVGVAAAAVAGHFSTLEEEATKAAEESSRELADLLGELQSINDELDALRTGGSIEVIVKERRLAEETAKAQEMGAAFKSKYGDVTGDLDKIRSLASGSRELWVQVWDQSSNEMKKVRVAASDIVADWEKALEQGQKVGVIAAQIRSIEEKSMEEAAKAAKDRLTKRREAEEKQGGEAAAESGLDSSYNALIRALDANTAAIDVASELSEGEYTAEDRSSREDRGVTEVPKEAFDAILAGIDPGESAKFFEEGLAAILNPFGKATEEITIGLTDVVTATADDIDSMNADFLSAGEAALDLRDPLEQFGDSLAGGLDSLGGAAGLAVTAIEGGAAGAGEAVGGVAGGAIGTAIGGPAGTAVGSALGSLIGGLLGDSLDKLIEALGIVTPLFDAIGTYIGAAQPVLVILGGLFVSIADAIISLIPIVLIVTRLIGAVLIPFVRLAQLLLLLVPIVSLLASIILVWVDALVLGIGWLDENFFGPLVDGAIEFVNVVIMAYNAIIDMIRRIPGFGEFGTKAEYMTRGVEAMPGVDQMINDVAEAAALQAADDTAAAGGGGAGTGAGEGQTEGKDSWGNELANVPSGFKAMAAIYASADAESGAGMAAPMQGMEMTINIENWNSKGDSQRDWSDLKRLARNGHKGKKASSHRAFLDEKN